MDGIKWWHIVAGGAAIYAVIYLMKNSMGLGVNSGASPGPPPLGAPGLVSAGPAREARAGISHFNPPPSVSPGPPSQGQATEARSGIAHF